MIQQFSSLEGTISSVFPLQGSGSAPCSMAMTLETGDGQTVYIRIDGSTYVLGQTPLRQGDRITAFYDSTAPMPFIYPPQYRILVIARLEEGQTAALDYFDQSLLNSQGTLQLRLSGSTRVLLPNGQYFLGIPGGQYLLAIYTSATRSLPAQAVPQQIVVFCSPSA